MNKGYDSLIKNSLKGRNKKRKNKKSREEILAKRQLDFKSWKENVVWNVDAASIKRETKENKNEKL